MELAIEIEKNGRFFYEVADRLDRNREIGDVFAKLAALEKEHENTFRDMLARLERSTKDLGIPCSQNLPDLKLT